MCFENQKDTADNVFSQLAGLLGNSWSISGDLSDNGGLFSSKQGAQ